MQEIQIWYGDGQRSFMLIADSERQKTEIVERLEANRVVVRKIKYRVNLSR